MPSVINCPSCERRLNVPDTLVGEAVKCPTCGETFTADPDGPPPARPDADEPRPERRTFDLTPEDRDDDVKRQPRRSRSRDDEAEEEDDRDDLRPRRRRPRKPGAVTAIGVMMLVGGILAIILFVGLGLGTGLACCIWPGTYYSLVMGILAVVKGSQLLGDDAHRVEPPRWVAVMMIINIVCADVTNLALGIVCLCLLNDQEVERYFRR
jgi:hypothetical protein